MTRNVTPDIEALLKATMSSDPTPPSVEMEDAPYRIYRLCDNKDLELIATCTDKASVGLAMVTLAEEGEFDRCPVGLMYRPDSAEKGKWLIKPWLPFPTPKTLSDAGRALRSARTA